MHVFNKAKMNRFLQCFGSDDGRGTTNGLAATHCGFCHEDLALRTAIVDYGTGNRATWIVFAHEVGHLLGAEHEDAGVMDGSRYAYGKVQFFGDNHGEIKKCLEKSENEKLLFFMMPEMYFPPLQKNLDFFTP